MSIERLRALEKLDEAFEAEIRRVSTVQYNSNEICRHFFGQLRAKYENLIAELGQEVGAVAMPLTDDEHEWLMYAVDHMLDDSEPEDKTCARVLQGLLDRCVVTSPAHTSEARDAVSVDVREMKTSLGRDYYVCVQVGDRYLTPNMYREKWKADFDAAEWTALFNGTARPDILSFMPEDAAMRQEGGE